MSRMLAIAAREYLAFVRTVGFWLSICLMPPGLLVADLRHRHGRQGRARAQARDRRPQPAAPTSRRWRPRCATRRPNAAARSSSSPPPGAPYADAAAAPQALAPYLAGETRIPGGDAARRRRDRQRHGRRRRRSTSGRATSTSRPAGRAHRRADRRRAPGAAGRRPASRPSGSRRSTPTSRRSPSSRPRAPAGACRRRDRLPAFVGFAMGFVLWTPDPHRRRHPAQQRHRGEVRTASWRCC